MYEEKQATARMCWERKCFSTFHKQNIIEILTVEFFSFLCPYLFYCFCLELNWINKNLL